MNGADVYIMVVWVGRTRSGATAVNKVNDAVYAGGATDFTRRWDGGGGGEWAGRNDEVDEDR